MRAFSCPNIRIQLSFFTKALRSSTYKIAYKNLRSVPLMRATRTKRDLAIQWKIAMKCLWTQRPISGSPKWLPTPSLMTSVLMPLRRWFFNRQQNQELVQGHPSPRLDFLYQLAQHLLQTSQNRASQSTPRAEGNLKLLAFYLRHQMRVSCVVTSPDITLETILTIWPQCH